MKEFFGKITKGIKKFFELITNKWLLKGTTTIAVIAIIIAGYIGLNWGVQHLKIEDIDCTTKKLYSLSDETKERLKNLKQNITIQLINLKDYTYIIEYVDKYQKVTDKVIVEKIDDLSTRVDLQEEYGIRASDSLIVIKNGERKKILTLNNLYTYDYATNTEIDVTEEAITNGVVEVTIEDKPQIYVFNGNTLNEAKNSVAIIANALINESNDIDLLDILTTGKVPDDCDCLIMTTLKQDISDLERDAISKYIDNGGKILLLTSQNILNVKTPNFNKILEKYGISLEYGIIHEQDSGKMLYSTPNMIVENASASFMNNIDMTLRVCLPNAGKIKFAEEAKLKELGVTYETIVSTSNSSFIRTEFNQQEPTRTDKDSKEESFIVGALATKTISEDKKSQLIIYANETFASTAQIVLGYQYISAVGLYNNEDVVLNSVSYLTEREDTIKIRKTSEVENYTVTEQEDAIIKTIIFVIPVLTICAGIVVWLVRRRQY